MCQIKLDPEIEAMGLRPVIEEVCSQWDISQLKRIWFKYRQPWETRALPCTWGKHTVNISRVTGEKYNFRISCFLKGTESDFPTGSKKKYGGMRRPDAYLTRKEAAICVFGHEFFHFAAGTGQTTLPNTEPNAIKCGLALVESCRKKGLV